MINPVERLTLGPALDFSACSGNRYVAIHRNVPTVLFVMRCRGPRHGADGQRPAEFGGGARCHLLDRNSDGAQDVEETTQQPAEDGADAAQNEPNAGEKATENVRQPVTDPGVWGG